MRDYDFNRYYSTLLTPDIVALLSQVHEFRGAQTLLIKAKENALTKLTENAKIQSVKASNQIEGICTTDERLKKIVLEKTMPKTPSETAIAGYRDVLVSIHENYDYILPNPSGFLQLQRDMYKYSSLSIGGHYRTADNVTEENTDGIESVCFRLVPVGETSEALERLCDALRDTSDQAELDPLLVIPMFILDFLCIQPFDGGNGRMSRLLTLLLLYRAGYAVGKYVSLEKLIADSKETYYEAVRESARDWYDGTNNYAPFVRYTLGIVAAAYQELSSRVMLLTAQGLSKPEQVRAVIRDTPGRITKAEIMRRCPDIAQITVQRTLNELLKSCEIIKISGGRYTAYTWNREKET